MATSQKALNKRTIKLMEVKVVEATADWYKIAFKDPGSGLQVLISISGTVIDMWKLRTDELIPTATALAGEIFFNHDPSIPFKAEYMFSPVNSGPSVEDTIVLIRQNSI